ncbi:MAG: DNA repair protein RecO C-terminal domain-containing protein [Treponema sp.]|nr:DNA repair protein RecO C-terminal domain-containing protein [Treponema sp.]
MHGNKVTQATVISVKPSGENNSSVCLLTKAEGVIYATLYGGPKSRLKSLVSTWNTGTIYLSLSHNHYKISDFDVKSYHLSFRENFYKSCAASVSAEIALKTHCGGNCEKAWALINGFLTGLDRAESQVQASSGLLRFLWRYLDLMGLQPDPLSCAFCGKKLEESAHYLLSENAFVGTCCHREKSPFVLERDALQFLQGITVLEPKDASALYVQNQAYSQLKSLIFYLIETACSSSLMSLKVCDL